MNQKTPFENKILRKVYGSALEEGVKTNDLVFAFNDDKHDAFHLPRGELHGYGNSFFITHELNSAFCYLSLTMKCEIMDDYT